MSPIQRPKYITISYTYLLFVLNLGHSPLNRHFCKWLYVELYYLAIIVIRFKTNLSDAYYELFISLYSHLPLNSKNLPILTWLSFGDTYSCFPL